MYIYIHVYHTILYCLYHTILFYTIRNTLCHIHTIQYVGNFWWTTTAYLSKLTILSKYVGKYYAEYWLLTSSTHARSLVIHDSNINHFEQSYLPYMYRHSTGTTNTTTATTNTTTAAATVLGEKKEGHNSDLNDNTERKSSRGKRSDIMYQTYNNDLNAYTTSTINEGQNYDYYSQRVRLKARLSYIKSGHNSDLHTTGIKYASTSSCVGFTYTNITMTSTV